ncbi:hypothetical protein J2X42_000888 [Arthrobacter sp. BE255]|nr:hypothetical protein [Arthrobacter sp. BE255]
MSEKQDVPVKSMTLFMATRQSVKRFLGIFAESTFDLFIGFCVRPVQWRSGTRFGLSLGARFGLPFGLICIKDRFHGEPEKQAHYK